MNSLRNYFVVLICLLFLAGLAADATAQTEATQTIGTPEWDEGVFDIFASLPVQNGGRVKPFDTFSQFVMLRMNGRRWHTTESGQKLYPVEWMLNCLFHPEVARDYRHFVVNTYEVIEAIGVQEHPKKRDRYTYNELLPGRMKLTELSQQYLAVDKNQRTALQQQIVNLAHNVGEFEVLSHFLDFARQRFQVPENTMLAKSLTHSENTTLSDILRKLPVVVAALRLGSKSIPKEKLDTEIEALTHLSHEVQTAVASAHAITLFPSAIAEEKTWRSPVDLVGMGLSFTPLPEEELALLGRLERMTEVLDDPSAFRAETIGLHEAIKNRAEARGEYRKIPLEVALYRGKFMFYSQWLFVFSFILIAVSWLAPRNKLMGIAAFIGVAAPLMYLVIGIILRCIIRGRPPVSTLYETLLFITAVAVLVALVIEVMNRRRIAVAIASFLGMLGMFLAHRFEIKEGVDTMPQLVAVLDTNFWLATHVTTVTMGYAAGLLAAALAHIYVVGKAFNVGAGKKAFYKGLSRMVYGVLCFGLLFSVLGTVLGGIWANDSWGRFWGWDPKENGALMICLWGLFILHARMGGYIRDLGVSVCAVVMGVIVAFSWWGVNLLGVGLHSYGFTTGIMRLLLIFYAAESSVVALGVIAWIRGRMGKKTVERRAREEQIA